MIDTTVTIEETFQVLDSIQAAPPGSTIGQYTESNPSGGTPLPTNTNVLSVTFVTTKTDSDYVFDELVVKNTVDSNPISFSTPEVIAVSTTGFSVQFSAVADTTNYRLHWTVRIPTT